MRTAESRPYNVTSGGGSHIAQLSQFKSFSKKQLQVLNWWCPSSPCRVYDALICDGAVRSGKTSCMAISFVAWAVSQENANAFAVCGKTISSLRRNILVPILPVLKELGFQCREILSQNRMEVSLPTGGMQKKNFYFFGGKDEGSAALIQGMTLGGVLFDEVALMPRSFVEQALARCSLRGSRFWFNCNPENPLHWFHREWIQKAQEKNCLYLHFTMGDNPSLTPEILRRYESLYSGAFHERFVLGKWVAAEGLVYPMFSPREHIAEPPEDPDKYYISCDYGTVNPSSFGLWGRAGKSWYRLAEYYFDSRRAQYQRTDEEHYAALEELAGELPVEAVIADPSAASFLACIRRHGRFRAVPAKNEVMDGIRKVCDALKRRQILFSADCKDSIREFGLYRWDNSAGRDSPRKENDHAMDDIRYFVSTVLDRQEEADAFFAVACARY